MCICVEVDGGYSHAGEQEEISKLLGFIFGGVNGFGKPQV